MVGSNSGMGAETRERRQLDAESWVERYGDFLFRQAFVRVGQREAAEDLVQETFLAAWKSSDRFERRSSEKTWLLQILRHKVADFYRRQRPEIAVGEWDELSDFERTQFEFSGERGAHWRAGAFPKAWILPWQKLERREFWQAVALCTKRLPAKSAQVFLLRDIDEVETNEICCRLSLEASHVFVLLHRARLAMRRCLEVHWFRQRGDSQVK